MLNKQVPLFWFYALALLVILLDQAIKLSVHFYMEPGYPGQIELLGSFFKLHYTLNPGMAFGIQLGSSYGKLILTTFRILAMLGIGYGVWHLHQRKAHSGLLICVALILGGAIGNLIDSIFYGVFLGNAAYGAPFAWFHGQVIDMFFFDVWEGILPDWIPIWGGTYYSTPIFNFADAAIFCGVVAILIFQNTFFASDKIQ